VFLIVDAFLLILIRKCLVFHIVNAFWLISLGNMY